MKILRQVFERDLLIKLTNSMRDSFKIDGRSGMKNKKPQKTTSYGRYAENCAHLELYQGGIGINILIMGRDGAGLS